MTKASKIISLAAVLLLAALALLLPAAHVAEANGVTDVWVAPPPLGNDGNPGTATQPFATIQKGIDTLELGSGGTVNVAAGTYHEHGLHLSETMNLAGAGALTTIIDGDANGYVIEVSSAPFQQNTISGFTIQNGAPAGSNAGGGIYISEAHIVTINDCAIVNNVKGNGAGPYPDAGGGVCNDGGVLYMNRCTVSGNTATNRGGGIFTHRTFGGDSGLVELTNCTISNNTVTDANGVGGGIYCGRTATMRLLNVTIANNQATGTGSVGGGFANGSPSSIYFKNCIVANNTAGDGINNNGFDDYGGAAVFSQGYNIDSENSCFFTDTTDKRNTNPLLGPLQNNGGQTSTHAILHGSPAVDAGTCIDAPATDQRGVTRPQDTNCDIGAYELAAEIAIPTTGPRSSPSIPTPPRPLNPPQMSVQYVSVNPQQTIANQPVTIITNVVNTGDEAGNLNIALKINGLVEQSRTVSVGPQGTQPVKFTIAKAQPGTYTVDILGEQGSFTVLGAGGTAGAPINSGLIALLIMGVLVLATVVVLILTRKPA